MSLLVFNSIPSRRFILDGLPAASAAYSLRKLRSAYSGFSICVRRSQDNGEADIGFNPAGELNRVALLSHVGANNGFVTTVYDQSGNGYHATQAIAGNQPQIVTNGVVDLANGKPVMTFSSSKWLFNTAASADASLWGSNPQTMNTVVRSDTTNDRDFFTLLGGSAAGGNLRSLGAPTSSVNWRYTTGADINSGSVPTSVYSIATGRYAASANDLRTNGTFRASGSGAENSTAGNITIGARTSAGVTPMGAGVIGECILFNTFIPDAACLSIERNQGLYYGIATA